MKYVPKTKPFPHQARATLRAARARNFAIFHEPRCGKTKAALDAIGMLSLAGYVKRVLILCPAIAKDVWDDQIERHYPYNSHVQTFDEEWTVERGSEVTTRLFIAGREETFRRTRDKDGSYLRPKQRILEKYDPDLIIIDESHEYQRPGGVASQDGWRLVRRLRMERARRQNEQAR